MDGDFKIPFDSWIFESNCFLSPPESQSVFTCTKLTIETLEKGVKYVNNIAISLVLVSLLLTLNFHIF